MTISLNSIHKIKATDEPDVYIVGCNITDMNGETYNCDYSSRPDGVHGLNPVIRQWLADNVGQYTIEPYIPPTIEEVRAQMPSLTARQLRLGLVNGGFSMSQVSAVIDAMPEGADKETARIEWEYATTFNRTHPLIGSVGSALGLDDAAIDAMWNASVSL